MTVKEIELAINSIRLVLEHTEKGYYPEQFKTHEECLCEVMDIVRKYQQMQEPIKALGKELRKARKGITDEKVLIGYNMAVAICNKHLGESEVEG